MPDGFPVLTLTVSSPLFPAHGPPGRVIVSNELDNSALNVRATQIQRALCALTLVDAAKLPLAVEALYQAFWVERNVALVNKPEGLAKLLSGVLGEGLAKEVMQKVCSKARTSCLVGR